MEDRAAIGEALVLPRSSSVGSIHLGARRLLLARCVMSPSLASLFLSALEPRHILWEAARATALIPFHSNAKPRQSAAKISVPQGFPKRWPAVIPLCSPLTACTSVLLTQSCKTSAISRGSVGPQGRAGNTLTGHARCRRPSFCRSHQPT